MPSLAEWGCEVAGLGGWEGEGCPVEDTSGHQRPQSQAHAQLLTHAYPQRLAVCAGTLHSACMSWSAAFRPTTCSRTSSRC